jgi:hypothetical protein
MNGLALIVVSAILAFLARSLWRRLVETSVLVVLFVLFVGVLTLITDSRAAFFDA